jgi:zinc transport system substrate-binding protein
MFKGGNKMKKFKYLIVILLSIFVVGCGKNSNEFKYSIITTNFAEYDFVRAIVKDSNVNVKILLKPGSEMHDYEPTPQDIIDIQKSNMFIYVGGESDSWIDGVLENIDTSKVKIIKLMDLVDVVEEEHKEGMEEDEEESDDIEYDEHVWTSPKNAITIIEKLTFEIKKIDSNNSELYQKNADNYIKEVKDIDNEIREVINSSKRKLLIFGDRFPLRYFVDEYNLDYYAAFSGCSEQSEASAKTIAFLVNKVKEDDIPVVFHIELSNGNIANAISNETGAKVLEFHSAHNISQKDFDNGITYVDIMKKNIEVLKEALD